MTELATPGEGVRVPVGVSTVVGYGSTAVGLLLAVLAFVGGDRSEQTLGTIAGATFAGLAYVGTTAMRTIQARTQIKVQEAAEKAAPTFAQLAEVAAPTAIDLTRFLDLDKIATEVAPLLIPKLLGGETSTKATGGPIT